MNVKKGQTGSQAKDLCERKLRWKGKSLGFVEEALHLSGSFKWVLFRSQHPVSLEAESKLSESNQSCSDMNRHRKHVTYSSQANVLAEQ